MIYDCIILGGGAAGLYCALHAGRRGRRTLVLEHNEAVGAKILISGGGRCNFTNLNGAAPDRYLSANRHFARSALSRHGPDAFIRLMERHRIAFYEKTLGQLFCEGDGAARRVVRMLLDECAAAGVVIHTGARVNAVSRGTAFRVETSLGVFDGSTLVLAAGGLSIPKLGATNLAHRLARQFDLDVIEPRPGLVPLVFADEDLAWMRPLSGVSAPVAASAGTAAFREAALFTHRGLSGPAILQASSYWKAGEPILLDWAPDAAGDFLVARKRERPKIQVKTALAESLPARLADALAGAMPQGAIGDLKDAALIQMAAKLKAWPLAPAGTEGFAKAEVTLGGVATVALSQQTMQAAKVPGLFVIGEAVDVTGWLGGYNFQWAWSSGWAAAQAV